MGGRDRRAAGPLTRGLRQLARDQMEPEDYLDADAIEMRKDRHRYDMPDCANCADRCCVHKGARMGILLSLQDIANLADSGFEDLIVGTFTFRRRKGQILPDIRDMPRLAKKQGNCVFYDPDKGTCTGYEFRPTICRRYPFEVDYTRAGKPFARYIPDSPCTRVHGKEHEPAIREMVREAVVDENVSLEDARIVPDCHEELRALGFGRWLPPEWECPSTDDE